MEVMVPRLPSFEALSPKLERWSCARVRAGFCNLCYAASSTATTKPAPSSISLGHITRPDFPILHQEINGSKLVYLDNAATSQKPMVVLKALQSYYQAYNSNVHRGIHFLSAKATDEYELARKKVATFINAFEPKEIVFTRNATEAINLVAYSWGLSNLKPKDEVVLTIAEHHSAIVPWQLVAQKTGAILKYVSLTEDEVPDIRKLRESISWKTKLVAVHHVSNVLASVLPIDEIAFWAHNFGAKVLVDACQSVPHMVVDVQKLDADFLVASSHKMCGPTGIGFLYGKGDLLADMPPFLGGGEMISDVFLDQSTFAEPPSRFEAGTPAIGEAIGLGAAVDYLSGIGMQKIHDYGHGVAIRSGHHCAQPLHRHLGVTASARASLYFYNTKEDVDNFIEALKDCGLDQAFERDFPMVKHRFCVRHLCANFKKTYKGKIFKDHVRNVTRASTREEWEQHMVCIKAVGEKIRDKGNAYGWLTSIPTRHCTRHAFKQFPTCIQAIPRMQHVA